MILYIITDTREQAEAPRFYEHRWTLERAANDLCVAIRYDQATRALVRQLNPWTIVHSGSGTPFDTYDVLRHPDYTSIMREENRPQLGICGGHQLMAWVFGGRCGPLRKLRRNDPDLRPFYHPGQFKEWGVYPVRILRRHPLFSGLGRMIRVVQRHKDEVKRLPTGFVALARSRDCAVQAMAHRHRPLCGVQFHPEQVLEAYPDGQAVLRNFFRMAREWWKTPQPCAVGRIASTRSCGRGGSK